MALSSGISVLSSQVPLTYLNKSSCGLIELLRDLSWIPGETLMTLIVGGAKPTVSKATKSGHGCAFCKANSVASMPSKFGKSHD